MDGTIGILKELESEERMITSIKRAAKKITFFYIFFGMMSVGSIFAVSYQLFNRSAPFMAWIAWLVIAIALGSYLFVCKIFNTKCSEGVKKLGVVTSIFMITAIIVVIIGGYQDQSNRNKFKKVIKKMELRIT